MSDGVSEGVVQAALRASRARGVPVGDVPLIAVAEEAGISRSTLMRRLGGTRRSLDAAVRAAGVDPGGQKSVRERAVKAAAELISEHGLVATTLEQVADGAQCSVHSLYAAFGGRDGLLQSVYERYSPVLDIEAALAEGPEDLPGTVHTVYGLLAEVLERQPRVMPAMLADFLSRPDDPAVRDIRQHAFSRMIAALGQWLADEVAAGRVRDLPPLLLVQQLIGPLFANYLVRAAALEHPGLVRPTTEETVDAFARNFLAAVAEPAARGEA